MRETTGRTSVLEYDCWTSEERRLFRGALEEHFGANEAGPFGEYDPTENATLVEAELVRRGWDVETSLCAHPSTGDEWHECTIAREGARSVTIRAPSFEQVVAMAAIEAVRQE